MGLRARLKASNPGASVLRCLDSISKICRIPPSSPVWTMPPKLMVTTLIAAVFLSVGLIVASPPPIFTPQEIIGKNFILPNRNPPSWPPDSQSNPPGAGFWMVGNETLVIRDCTMYVDGSQVAVNNTLVPPEGLKMPHEGYAIGIYLTESANLTMINVKVYPAIDIAVLGNAYLKMVNVTNYHPAWKSHGSDNPPRKGVYSLYFEGAVRAADNARVWIENSRIAGVSKDDLESGGGMITLRDNVFMNSIGNTAVKVSASIDKTVYKWGEPISMVFHLENVGDTTLNFSDRDYFKICAYNVATSVYKDGSLEKAVLYVYRPTSPRHRFPAQLRPGETMLQTLTLMDDGSTPFMIRQLDGPMVLSTNTWWNSSLGPGEWVIHGGVQSWPLEFGAKYGEGAVMITDEKWQR